jgi:hypothetical protein
LAVNPDNAALLAVVGQGRLAVGRPADAANVLRRLVEKQPQSADAHFLLAQAYQAVGDQGGYRVELEKTLELAPDRLPAKFQLAFCFICLHMVQFIYIFKYASPFMIV